LSQGRDQERPPAAETLGPGASATPRISGVSGPGASPPPRVPGLSAVVLCGGRSLRFGDEKGLARFRGTPLVARALARLDELTADVWISTQRSDLYGHLGRPMIADLLPGCGPLAGIHAALGAVRHPLLAVISCDMPFASPGLLRCLCEKARNWDGAVPSRAMSLALPGDEDRSSRDGPCEPLHAVYARSCLPAIAAALARGDRRVVSFFPEARVRLVPEEEWLPASPAGDRIFANINTPDDLARLERSALA
jgi:molybdopterin-guanine dinucleotide biosynthesis protein A